LGESGVEMRQLQHFAYARHALVAAFRMCGVGSESKVLLPNFICRDVLASLRAVGASPVYYDIDTDLQTRNGQDLPRVDVVLAVNYFGFASDLKRLRTEVGVSPIIIEDNAHGWLSESEDGQKLGSRTPIGLTSFRKTIFTPDGAFLEWDAEKFSADFDGFDSLSSRSDRLALGYQLRRTAHSVERVTRLPVLLTMRSIVRSSRRAVGRSMIDSRPEEEHVLPTEVAIHQESLRTFMRINREREMLRRRNQFLRCAEIASECGILPVFSALPDGVVPQGFPYYANQGNERCFASRVQRQRLGEVMSWPALPQSTTLGSDSPLRLLRLVNFLR
jgi:hypothetical protein